MFSILLFLKNRNFLSRSFKENKIFLFHCEFKQFNGGKKELHEHLILFVKHQIAIFYTCIHLYTVIVSKCFLFCFFISLICYQYFLFDWTTWNWQFTVKNGQIPAISYDSTFMLENCIFIHFHLRREKIIHSTVLSN